MVHQGPLAAVFERQLGVEPGRLVPALARVLLPAERVLPVAPATDRRVWDADTGTADRITLRQVLDRAAVDHGRPWPQPRASDAARVHRDGDRETWERTAFEREHRLSRAAIAAAATLADAWIDEVTDGVWLLCEQSSWCWPAHDDAYARRGSVLADVTNPFLDLGAGEVVGQLAWIDHLLGAQLDGRCPGLRARIRHEARSRVFEPFRRRRDWHWLGVDGHVHNWNPWIHGNVMVAALRLLDGEERADVVALAIEGIDRYVASLPPDGAIDEGYAYWWNGACRALEALDVLSHATGDRLDAVAEVAAMRETIAFPHRMHLGADWYLNLADGQARPPADQPWHALHRAARRVGDPAAESLAASHRAPGAPVATEEAGFGRMLRGMTDPEWSAAGNAHPPLPRDVWLPSIQVLVARERDGGATGLTVAVKGGHNGENHNHNDVGSFVVTSSGVPVIVDAGRPTYTAKTFGPDRYSIWTMQSSWHNVPEVREVPQSTGRDAAASGVVRTVSDEEAELVLDLAAAYGTPELSSWRRTVRLERQAPSARVVIEDDWRLEAWSARDEPPTTIRLLIAGEVTCLDDGAVVAPLDGAAPVRIRWGDLPAALTVRPLDDPMLSDVWGTRLTRVTLDVSGLDRAVVTVELHSPTAQDPR